MVLCIEPSKSAQAARDYFTKHLAPGDYYLRGTTALSQWYGKELGRVGLAEGQEVTAKDFGAIADNTMPGTGERLTVRDAAKRKPGYDFMVAVPKSVSAMWARTQDERILEKVKEATIEWLREDVEPNVQTRLRRAEYRDGEEKDITVGNLIASVHPHLTTRKLKEDNKPDPQIHLHCFVHNACWADHEQRFQAVQFGGFVAAKGYYEACWESRLAAKLREIGYELAKDGKGRWELTAVAPSVTAKFSRRRFAEILPEAKRRGIEDAAGRKHLGRLTRQAKGDGDELATPELHDYWNGKLTPEETAPMDAAYARSLTGGQTLRRKVTARQAVGHAIDHFFGPDGRESAVAETAVLEEALRYAGGDVLAPELARELARRPDPRRDQGPHGLHHRGSPCRGAGFGQMHLVGTRRLSPLLAGKAYLPEQARAGKLKLDDEQQHAVGAVLASRDRIMALIGKSGAGKSTTLAALDQELRQRGRRLMAFAPTATASRKNLVSKGFADATTVQMLITSKQLQDACRGQVVLIDEITQAGVRSLLPVFQMIEQHHKEGYDTRCLVVGDPLQHRGVPRGEFFTIAREQAGLEPVARLNTIRRQRENPEYLKAVEFLSDGKTGEAFDLLDKLGFIHEIADPEERYRQMAKDYADGLAAGTSEMIVSPTHAEGRAVTAAVREELRRREVLKGEDRELVRDESKERSIAQRKDASFYEAGDVVQWHKAAPGFQSGERLTVVAREDKQVWVKDDSGTVKQLPLQHAERFELYRTSSLPVADGERLRITRNGTVQGRDGKQHRITNGDMVTVRVTPEGLVDQRGWIIPASYGHLASGVVTSHSSQSLEDPVPFLAQSTASRGALQRPAVLRQCQPGHARAAALHG